MYFDTLPTEIVTHIFLSLPTVASALSLASTCSRFHGAFHSSKRLVVLRQSAEQEFGPLDDIVQLVTHNASQPAHIHRDVPISDALIRQIVKVGRVAQKWEEIYPLKKWRDDYVSRRLLTNPERLILRRALYRLWLFSRAFHNAAHVRYARTRPAILHQRAALLHNFSTPELAEMLDLHTAMRDLVANNLCPSNGRMRQKFHTRYPDTALQPGLSIHLSYPPSFSQPEIQYHSSPLFAAKHHSRQQLVPHPCDYNLEGWGDDIGHYYIVEDMMKLDPEQILFLREHCPGKAQVEAHVAGFGAWFENNGETFSETLGFVIKQRGGELEELKGLVEEGKMGVVVK